MDIEIILTGSFGVGKSSIYNRFIYDEFSNKYYGTLGVRVNVKQVVVNEVTVNFKLWDIAGEVKQDKVPEAYFQSPTVIIYVVDLNRDFAIKNVSTDLAHLQKIGEGKTILMIGNKEDLMTKESIKSLLQSYPDLNFHLLTSAKTGENIDFLFNQIALQEIERQLSEKNV